MKKGLEELKNIDPQVIAARVHIVQTTIEDMLNKRFEKINPVKAKGLVKILEQEFDLDLSDWLTEFEAFREQKEPVVATMDKLHMESAKEETKRVPKTAIAVLVAIALGATIFFSYSGGNKTVEPNTTATVENNAGILNTITVPSENNQTIEANKTNENNASLNINATAKPQVSEQKPIQNGAHTLYAEPSSKVWMGIKYLDTEKDRWFEDTIKGRYDFNASREQLITFGHAMVKLVADSNATTPVDGGKIRYHYKDGVIKKITVEEYDKLSEKKKH